MKMRPIAMLLAAGVALVAMTAAASAEPETTTSEYSGQGTAGGVCESVEEGDAPAGRQFWQFNLTQTSPDAVMSASFSDGTTVSDLAPSSYTGKVAKWLIETEQGATVESGSATYAPDGPNSQFVVSHCVLGAPVPPDEPPAEEPEPPAATPPAAASPSASAPAAESQPGSIAPAPSAPAGQPAAGAPTAAATASPVIAQPAVAG